MNDVFDEIIKKLNKAQKIGIFTHEKPDGDALGSSVAAKAILKSIGKDAEIYLLETIPEKYSFLNGEYTVLPKETDIDTALALDCGAPARLGGLVEIYNAAPVKLAVDHHLSHDAFGDLFYSDHTCAANAEIVFKMAKALCGEVPEEAMRGIYTGLSTDTGHFKYSNVTKNTLNIAAELIGRGLNHREITVALYDTVKLNKLKFNGAVAELTEFMHGGMISFLYSPDELFKKYDIDPEDAEELPNTILNIEGVKISVLFKDKENGGIKVSLRGKDIIDLSVIASGFGGGGHMNAAAFRAEGDMEKIKKELIRKIESALSGAENV